MSSHKQARWKLSTFKQKFLSWSTFIWRCFIWCYFPRGATEKTGRKRTGVSDRCAGPPPRSNSLRVNGRCRKDRCCNNTRSGKAKIPETYPSWMETPGFRLGDSLFSRLAINLFRPSDKCSDVTKGLASNVKRAMPTKKVPALNTKISSSIFKAARQESPEKIATTIRYGCQKNLCSPDSKCWENL